MSKYAIRRGRTQARFAHIHPVMENIFFVVRVNRSNSDTFAAKSLADALELAQPDEGDSLEFGTVEARDAGMARLMRPVSGWQPVTK